MHLSEAEEVRFRQMKLRHNQLRVELFKTIPSFGHLMVAGLVDLFIVLSPLVVLLAFVLTEEVTMVYTLFLVVFVPVLCVVDFVVSLRYSGSTVGMLLFGLFLVDEHTMQPIDSSRVWSLLFGRFMTDIIYNDWYEGMAFMDSPKLQTITMREQHIIYADKRRYREFAATHADQLNQLPLHRFHETEDKISHINTERIFRDD